MIGQRLGPYEITDIIGTGGMATVYRAQQTSVGRDVAIKVIHSNMADMPDAIQRFQREARLIARLEHVHILPVYDFDGSHDPPYIVMRFLEGGTLKEVLAQGLLPLPEVAYLMRQVCSAVDYANRQGITHRDLKPSNVMIDREGNAFVVDFGIAHMAAAGQDEKQITATGAVIGTPDYMSPEQAQGEEGIDHRADIYARGVILFEMLTGQLPYQASTSMKRLMMHVLEPVPSLLAVRADLPPALEAVVQQAMAKAPDERYDSALGLVEALTVALNESGSPQPAMLREAAGTAIMRRVKAGEADKGSSETPSEQNKTVTVVSVGAADYALLVEEMAGTEAVSGAMASLWTALEKLVTANGGLVLSRTDSTRLCIWGAEVTRESDAEQAIRTALQMQSALLEIGAAYLGDDEEELPLNIGLNSGLVLLKPSEDTGTLSAVGATLSIANRLRQNAFGTILISHATFRQVLGVFDIEEDVPLRLRGRKEPVLTYRVTAAKARAFKLDVRTIEGVETQMVGREAELKHCQQAYLDAIEEEETQVVTLLGEGGLGKSRLLYEVNKWLELRPEEFRGFEGRATENMRERPYALIRDIISMRCQILDSDPVATITAKLEAGLNDLLGADDPESAHFIGYLCGFDLSASPYLKGILDDPQQIAQLGRQKFIRLITTIAADIQPVVMRLEDMHHADESSLDLLTELFTRNEELPFFVICVARPSLLERRQGWGKGHELYRQLELKPLSKRDSRRLVRELLQKVADIPKALRDLLVERAEGNPFYMEELVKMLLDDRIILRESDEVWRVETERLKALQVPTSLYGLLEARLDTLLTLEKLTLQRAAVVGRVFFDTALAALDRADDYTVPQLDTVLETLVQREFIYRRETTSFAGSVEYIFARNMVRDAIVNTLLSRQVQLYNQAAAEWLETTAGARRAEYLPQIAQHYAQAGIYDKAADLWLEAGEAALSLGDFKQALGLFRQAYEHLPHNVRLLRQMTETTFKLEGYDAAMVYLNAAQDVTQSDIERLQLLLAHRYILSRIGLFDEVAEATAAALPLARQVNDPRLLAEALLALATVNKRLGKLDEVLDYLDEALVLARQSQDTNLELVIIDSYGSFYGEKGDHEKSLAYRQQMLELARKVGNRDLESTALNNMAIQLYHLDYETHREQIYSLTEQALMIATELDALPSIALYEGNLAEDDIYNEDYSRAQARLRTVLGIGLSANILKYVHFAVEQYTILLLAQGQTERGLALWGLMRQQQTWRKDAERTLQNVLKRYQIPPEVAEAGMAAGAKLDYEETLAQIQAELAED